MFCRGPGGGVSWGGGLWWGLSGGGGGGGSGELRWDLGIWGFGDSREQKIDLRRERGCRSEAQSG